MERHRFHGKNIARHLCDLARDGGMLPDRHAPLHALARPFAADFEQALGQSDARRGDRQAPGVQGRERDLQTRAFLRDHVLARHAHVREFHNAVVERAQSHEMAAICDFKSGRINIDDERSDLFALLAVDDFWRRLRHDYEHARFDQVRAPKLLAVQDERRTVFRGVGAQTHVRRVRSGIPFRERKRGNLATRHPRQIFFLLLFRAEQ